VHLVGFYYKKIFFLYKTWDPEQHQFALLETKSISLFKTKKKSNIFHAQSDFNHKHQSIQYRPKELHQAFGHAP